MCGIQYSNLCRAGNSRVLSVQMRKMNRLNRGFLEGEGSQGMGGILYGCVGGGVEAMLTKNF